MKRSSFFFAASITLVGAGLCHGQSYQKIADATPWGWSADRATVADSFLRLPNTYQAELIRPKDKSGVVIICLTDGGKELYSWMGHYGSVFALSGDVLVYADYGQGRTGCSLIAYDLMQKKQLWQTALKGLGPIPHSRYSNSVNLEYIDNATVRVFGNESAGKYLEFVDINTGKTVGHRTY